MDSGRLGRVLGVGARHAAKTLVGAVDAATAPSPRQGTEPDPRPVAVPSPRPPASAGQGASTARVGGGGSGTGRVLRAGERQGAERSAVGQRRGLAEGGRRFRRAVWEPAVRLSGVLWLEVTGLFFGIFAMVAGGAVWRLRGGLRPGAPEHERFLWAIGMLALFGYFTVSSFLSARRRGRRRS